MSLSKATFNHMIVWLDQNIAAPDRCRQLKQAFATTTNPESKSLTSIVDLDITNLIRDVQNDGTERDASFLQVPFTFKLFADINQCRTFLLENAGKMRIFFITSGSLGQYIVPGLLTDHRHVFSDKNGNIYGDSIYIFCADMLQHMEWAGDFLELKCIQMFDDDKGVLARLTRDIAKYFESEGKQQLVKDDMASLKKAHQYFCWTKQLYLQAETVVKGFSSATVLNNVNGLIFDVEQKMEKLKPPTNESDDDTPMGQEN